MLIRSDVAPGTWGRFRIRGQLDAVDAGEAFTAIGRGQEVIPDDAATVARLADELEQSGNGTRAAMIRRVGSRWPEAAATDPTPEPSAPVPSEPPPPPPPPPSDPMADAQKVIDAAGDNVVQLTALAHRAGMEVSARWKADRLRTEIQAAVSRNFAAGLPAFRG